MPKRRDAFKQHQMPPLNLTRTVRSVVFESNGRQPVVSKHWINVVQHQCSDRCGCQSDDEWEEHSEITVDRIIHNLRSDHDGQWPSEILLLITPSSRHLSQYKLHVIDRDGKNHLGVTSITRNELSQLQASQAFQQYCVVLGNKFIDLKTVALKTAVLSQLVNSLNHQCGYQPCKTHNDNKQKSQFNPQLNYPKKTTQQKTVLIEQPLQKAPNDHHSCMDNQKSQLTDGKDFNISHFTKLIDRINNTPNTPNGKDVDKFFTLAEQNNLIVYIRPDLSWKTSNDVAVEQQKIPLHFHIECFMPIDHYLGGITLEGDQLEEQLFRHMNLLPQIHIIRDVFELTPVPKMITHYLHIICNWFGLEILYDAIGEFIFNIYKQCD